MLDAKQWAERLSYYQESITKISIPSVPSEVDIKQIVAKIDTLYTQVVFDYAQIKTDFEKINSTIDRCHAKSKTGSNEDARKLASIAAAENYELADGKKVNLYKIRQEIYERKEKIEAAKSIMDKKLNLLQISYGTLKMESNLL
jgi:hypothetical protein